MPTAIRAGRATSDHALRARASGRARRAPRRRTRPRLLRPLAELEVGQAAAREPGLGVDPQERAAAAEMAERRAASCACPSSAATCRRAARSRGPSRSGRTGRGPGSTPGRPGNCTDVASASVSGATSVGREALAGERDQVVERAVHVGGRRAAQLGAHPERLQHGRPEVLGEGHPGALRRAARPRPRCPGSSRSAACPAGRSASRRGTAAPRRATSRCRSVEPGGPAGSSRSTVPSSAATSTASVVSELRERRPAQHRVARAARAELRAVADEHGHSNRLGRPAVEQRKRLVHGRDRIRSLPLGPERGYRRSWTTTSRSSRRRSPAR